MVRNWLLWVYVIVYLEVGNLIDKLKKVVK